MSPYNTLQGYRVYGAVPPLLERVVPETLKGEDTFDLMGFELPPGTIVATQAWSMHRDSEVFPSPETFLPERWLRVDGTPQEDERLSRSDGHLFCVYVTSDKLANALFPSSEWNSTLSLLV